MPNLSLAFQRIEYITDRRVPITAWRAFAEVAFTTRSRAGVTFSCVLDPGAPFNVLPYSLWHGRQIDWQKLGIRASRKGSMAHERVEWQGVLCDLGMTDIYLVDSLTGLQAGPFVMRAKFARQRQRRENLELIALLGMNFIAENRLRLVLDGHHDAMTGFLSFP
jgi:hypothetical protein